MKRFRFLRLHARAPKHRAESLPVRKLEPIVISPELRAHIVEMRRLRAKYDARFGISHSDRLSHAPKEDS
jgi:hypothetical protein